jgi:hypothetical protein
VGIKVSRVDEGSRAVFLGGFTTTSGAFRKPVKEVGDMGSLILWEVGQAVLDNRM